MPSNHNDVRSAPRARSYTQLSTYADCGKRFELAYERRVPRRPGVWFPAGTALHKSIERYLREVAVPKETS
jgi:hypothetical protein